MLDYNGMVHSSKITTLDKLIHAIRGATERRREWVCQTIPGGWRFEVDWVMGDDFILPEDTGKECPAPPQGDRLAAPSAGTAEYKVYAGLDSSTRRRLYNGTWPTESAAGSPLPNSGGGSLAPAEIKTVSGSVDAFKSKLSNGETDLGAYPDLRGGDHRA